MSAKDHPSNQAPIERLLETMDVDELAARVRKLEGSLEAIRGDVQRAIATSFDAHRAQDHAGVELTSEVRETTAGETYRAITNLATELRVASHDLGFLRGEAAVVRRRLTEAEQRLEQWAPLVEAMLDAVSAPTGSEASTNLIGRAVKIAADLRGARLRVVE